MLSRERVEQALERAEDELRAAVWNYDEAIAHDRSQAVRDMRIEKRNLWQTLRELCQEWLKDERGG